MVRFRILGLALMAVFAMSALSSASALATPECEPPQPHSDYAVCVENSFGTGTPPTLEYEGLLENTNHNVASVLKGKIGSNVSKLTGTTAVAKLKAEDSGKSTGEIVFTNITVVEPAKCKVAEPIIADFTDQLSAPPAAITDTFTGSKPEETFAEITFENNGGECALKGQTVKVKGKQKTKFDAGIETMQGPLTMPKGHEVITTLAESELFIGENAAKFEATFKEVEPVELPTGSTGNWAIWES